MIRDALAATDLTGEQTIMPWKRVEFDEMGQNNDADPVLLQYIGGKFVTIFPPQAAIAEAVWPMKSAGNGWGRGTGHDHYRKFRPLRHCEERSDEAIHRAARRKN